MITQSQIKNIISQFEDDFFMCGQYNLDSTERVTQSLKGMIKIQSLLDSMVKGLNMKWPSVYLDHASIPTLYGFHLHTYNQAMY